MTKETRYLYFKKEDDGLKINVESNDLEIDYYEKSALIGLYRQGNSPLTISIILDIPITLVNLTIVKYLATLPSNSTH